MLIAHLLSVFSPPPRLLLPGSLSSFQPDFLAFVSFFFLLLSLPSPTVCFSGKNPSRLISSLMFRTPVDCFPGD